MSAVAFGSLDRIIKAGNLSLIKKSQLGSYSVLLQSLEILMRSIAATYEISESLSFK